MSEADVGTDVEDDDRGKLVNAQADAVPGGALVEAARVFSCAVAVGSIVAGLLLAGSAVFPPLLLLTPPYMAAFVLAGVYGGAGGALTTRRSTSSSASRSRGWKAVACRMARLST